MTCNFEVNFDVLFVLKKGVAKRQCEVEEYSSQLLVQAENSCIMFAEQQDEKVRMLIQQMQNVQLENEEMRQQRLRHQQDRNKLHVKVRLTHTHVQCMYMYMYM